MAAAESLRADLADRRSAVWTDAQVLREAEEVDRLVTEAGAEIKAKRDLVGLEAEHTDATTAVRRLRAEARPYADAAPPRDLAARLREFSRVDGEQRLAARQIEDERQRIEDRGVAPRRRSPQTRWATPSKRWRRESTRRGRWAPTQTPAARPRAAAWRAPGAPPQTRWPGSRRRRAMRMRLPACPGWTRLRARRRATPWPPCLRTSDARMSRRSARRTSRPPPRSRFRS
jgi:hypothetical protein